MKNIEVKASYGDLKKAEKIAVACGAEFQWRKRQTDTYFMVRNGRLKLREVENQPVELIGYFRAYLPNSEKPFKRFLESNYRIVQLPSGETIKNILSATLGILVVVNKIRILYLFENVRIHLDEVEGPGNFIEFEGVIHQEDEVETTRSRLRFLQNQFEIEERLLEIRSYGDLLVGK